MREDQQTYARASSAALVGLITQGLLAVGMAVLGVYAQSAAFQALTWHFIAGLAIWAVLWIVYKQHQTERAEALEAEQLAQADARTAALFEEAGQQLHAARNRLDNFYKYLLPAVSLALGLYLIAVGGSIGLLTWQAFQNNEFAGALLVDSASPVGVALTALIVAFVAFLVSRYVAGMTRIGAWELLRGGAGFLMGNAFLALLAAVAAFLAVFGIDQPLVWLALLVPACLLLLGSEILINFVLAIYRPRRADEMPRPAFDSRLLGWLTRPESMGRIVSETLNYQFGFEISRSWFYRLLARALTPLIAIAILVLWGMSSIVVVAPQQQALISSFGQLHEQPRVVDAGLHFKLPWPLGRAEKFDVHRVQQVLVGSKTDTSADDVAILWTNEHAEEAESFLLTAPAYVEVADDLAVDSPLGELAGAQIQINYWIGDVVQYARSAQDPHAMMRYIAEREVSAFFAAHTIDQLLKNSQRYAPQQLAQRIRERLEQADIGLELVSVNLLGVHPPQDNGVAAAFHERINVLQENATELQKAHRDAVISLAQVAGSQSRAQQINEAANRLRGLEEQINRASHDELDEDAFAALQQQVREHELEIEQLIERAGGEAAQRLHEARAQRWSHALAEQGEAASFASHLALYRQAPRYYMQSQYLQMLGEQMDDSRKFIFAIDQLDPAFMRLELDDRQLDWDAALTE